MRIATWNLQRGGSATVRRAQDAVLRHLAADIVVLTEPGPAYFDSSGIVTSRGRRADRKGDEAWVAIAGPSVEPVPFDMPFERMAVAATTLVSGVPVLVYGSVLPWGFVCRDAPELVHEAETALGAFLRVLQEQREDIEELRRRYPSQVVIWAGDFNQTISGPNHGGSATKREALLRALDELGLVAWNASAAHAVERMHAIDLICGPREISIARQGRMEPALDGVVMSDHAGYWVEV
jgi:endonuclease/exonuclease/phosphatase family metal-dependent hydrolase